MKIIFGLGNLENEYTGTRHNVGFMFLDYLKSVFKITESWEKGFLAEQVSTSFNGEKFLLVKPSTFMNLSGDCVGRYVGFYKLGLEDILVVHDDLDIPLGGSKLGLAKGPKVHNGVSDIELKLGSKDFWRLRIGIENRGNKNFAGKDYVLGRFTKDELEILNSSFEDARESLSKRWLVVEGKES